MKLVQITDLCDIQVGKTPSRSNPSYWGKGYPWLSIADMNQGILLKRTKETITEKAVQECKCKIIPEDSVLMSFKLSIGKVGITKIPLFTNEAIAAFIIKDNSALMTKYLLYALKSIDHSIMSNKAVMGKTLNKALLSKIRIPLYPIEAQKDIVRILDEAYQLRQKRKESLALLDEYLKSVFNDKFGNPLVNKKSWQIVNLGDLLLKMTSGSRGWAKYYANDGDYFFTIKNVGRNNTIIFHNLTYINPPMNAEATRTKVQESDILMSITADLGRTVVIPKLDRDAYINQHLVILRLRKNINPVYISHLISTNEVQNQIKRLNKGAAKAGLNFEDIRSIKILLPPIEKQNEYADSVLKAEVLKKIMVKQAEELDNQFNALMLVTIKAGL